MSLRWPPSLIVFIPRHRDGLSRNPRQIDIRIPSSTRRIVRFGFFLQIGQTAVSRLPPRNPKFDLEDRGLRWKRRSRDFMTIHRMGKAALAVWH